MGRHPALTVLMVIFGLILLLPGLCAVLFMATGGGNDSALIGLWLLCILVSLGGIWLLVKAFR